MLEKTYIPLINPFTTPFEQMSALEAKQYFEWFVQHVDERSEYLLETVAAHFDIPKESLEYSPDVLIIIWRWFLTIAKTEKTSWIKQIRKYRELKKQGHSVEFIKDILQLDRNEMSSLTKHIVFDIGMYVGRTMLEENSMLRWDYYTDQRDMFVNRPQIFGFVFPTEKGPFDLQFDPIHYVEMEASRLYDKSCSDNDLYDMYQRWREWISS